MQEHTLNNNITLYKQDKYFKDEHINNKNVDIEGMIICINLRGKAQYKSLISDYDVQVKANQTIIDILKSDEGVAKTHNNTHHKVISLLISKDFLIDNIPLDKYTDNFHHDFEYGKNIRNISHQ